MRPILLIFLLLAGSLSASMGQEPAAKPAPSAAQAGASSDSAATAVPVKLGSSIVELAGPWRFHTGDDSAWAQPGFDDSGWETVDLTIDPNDPSGLAPGWTARGHPGYSGFAWYRLKIDVQGARQRVSLKMPDDTDDAYQLFVNGTMIGEFGSFKSKHVTPFVTIPTAFPLPKQLRNGPVTIAVRMWMDSSTPFSSPDAGGLRGPLELGTTTAINDQVRLDFDDLAHELGTSLLEDLILFMSLLMAGTLFWLDRSERAYLWLAIVCAITLLGNLVIQLANLAQPMGQTVVLVLSDVLSSPARIGAWVIFWAYWFHIRRVLRIHAAAWTCVVLLAGLTLMLRPPLYGEVVPVHASAYLFPAQLTIKLTLGALMFGIAAVGFRRQRAEGWLVGSALVLAVVANFHRELRLIHIHTNLVFFGFQASLGNLSTIVSLLIITVMLLRRFIFSQRKQEQWKLEIEQARQVQQILIPHELPQVEGLTIASEYRPAREVGGDFFQILPEETAGAAIIVVGDVTGKGMQAGMLVALIVGAIRSATQHSSDPAKILAWVNDQLCERGQASATCMIMRIAPDGAVTMSHAGHLPPYVNGTEMEIEGALPLGVIGGMDFPTMYFQLEQGDSMLLMSDGICEAQNAQGELFGFDRIAEMLRAHATVADIATAAQKFGQEDDILVLQLEWSGAPAAELVAEPELTAY